MSAIFISYVAEDAAIVREIAIGLKSAGYATWFYENDVVSGISYVKQISQALDQCQAFLLVASPRSVGSTQVTKEVMGAFERGKPFFPVLVELRPSKLKQLQPEWRFAIGVTSMVIMGEEGVPGCFTCIVNGLKALGIEPERPVSVSSSYTPTHIADKILATQSSMEGERKQVTVLFADVVDFTHISEQLDLEQVHDLIRECLSFITEEIHRYEGTIGQFLGDAVMALFGAPVAHEDAPQRALYAALSIRERIREYASNLKQKGIEFNMHIGLNSGLVMVGKIGDDLTMEYTAMGDTGNLASCMGGMAQPGAILVSENTYRLTECYFVFKSLGEIEVKGRKQPVKAYELLQASPAKTRFGASVARGLTPFVGRRKEIEHLVDCYDKSKKGQGQVVGIVGELGVGKSRLLLQMRETLPQEEYSYLEGGCFHYGGAVSYLPLLNILRYYFGIDEGEPESSAKQKMREKIGQLDQRLETYLPPLQDILSLKVEDEPYLKLDPPHKREKAFEAIQNLLIRESQNRPLILAVEDLHWMDRTSEEFLGQFITSLAHSHIFLILLYRPEYTSPWTSKTYYSQLRVDELSLEISAEMVQAMLREGKASPELNELILGRAAGNPLFMEELTRTLLDRGYIKRSNGHYVLVAKPSEIQVPETVQGIIGARIDCLDEKLKQTLQVASVIGRTFSFPVLQNVIGEQENLKSHLSDLQSQEFIYEETPFPELEYIFKHALTQEVAYNSLLIKRRKEIHERIGKAIEDIYADKLEEFYEILAFHFRQAESLDKAVYYLVKSADKNLEHYAVEISHQQFEEAFDIISRKPHHAKEDELLLIDIMLRWAWTFFLRGDFKGLTDLLYSYEQVAQSLDDKERLGMFYAWLGFGMFARGNFRHSHEYLCEALKLGEEISNQRVIGYSCCWLTWLCPELGLIDEAITFGERAQEASRILQSDPYLCYESIAGLGYSYYHKGYKKKTIAAGQALIEYSRSHKSTRSLVLSYLITGLSHYMDDDFLSAIECFKQLIQASQDPFYTSFAKIQLGLSYIYNGQATECEQIMQQVYSFSREFGYEAAEYHVQLASALTAIAKGELSEGLKNAEAAIRTLLSAGRKSSGATAHRHIGKLYASLIETVPAADLKAIEHLTKSAEIAKEIGAQGSLGAAYLDLGLLHKINGQNDQARDYISNAISLFEECGLGRRLGQAREALESLR